MDKIKAELNLEEVKMMTAYVNDLIDLRENLQSSIAEIKEKETPLKKLNKEKFVIEQFEKIITALDEIINKVW